MKNASCLCIAALYCAVTLLSCSSGGGGGSTVKEYKQVVDYSDFTSIPRNIVCAGGGVLYLTTGNNAVYTIDAYGVSTVVSSNTLTPDTYNNTVGIAMDGAGNLYVGNDLKHTIIKIIPAGTPSVFIGETETSGHSNTPPVTFNRPYGVAYDTENDILYVGDSTNSTVRKVECANANVTSDFVSYGFVYSVKVDAEGSVYAASGVDNIVRKYSPAGAVLATYTFNSTDEPAIYDFAVAPDGIVYAVDYQNSVIWRADTDGTVTLFAGIAGTATHVNGLLADATFNKPKGIAIDEDGTIYIADSGNSRIRKIALE